MAKTSNVKAKDVAARCVAEKLSVEDVKKLIPVYSNALPRRAWIKTFRDALPETEKKKFDGLI